MPSTVKCDNCPRTYQFADRQAGTAWLRVEVLDGDEEPNKAEPAILMSAKFCCPECAEAYLCNPELAGSIRFPDQIGCHGAREANFPIISRSCHDQEHSKCGGRAVKNCQCYCHAEKALSEEDDRTFEEKLRAGDVHLEPDEPYCQVCTWPQRLCVCPGSKRGSK